MPVSSRPRSAAHACVALLCLAPSIAAPSRVMAAGTAGRAFTAHDLVMLDRISDPQVSPDGRILIFTQRHTDLAANHGVNEIERLDLTQPHARPQKLRATTKGGSSARWSADERAIYFLSDRSGSTQLWRVPATGGPAVQASRLPLDILAYRLAADGKHAVVALSVFPDAEAPAATAARLQAKQADKASGQLHDTLFVRHWDEWEDGRRNHLFALALDGSGVAQGAAVPLMPGFDGDAPSRPFGDEADFALAPDGRRVFFSARPAGHTEPWSTNFDIYAVPMDASLPPADLTRANLAWDAEPVVSPDGGRLAYRAMKRPGFEADRFGVMVMDLKTGVSREIDPAWDRSADTLAWSADGRTLFVTAADTGQTPAFALDVATGTVRRLTGEGHIAAVIPTGPDLIVQRDTLASPARFWRLPLAGGTATPLADPALAGLAGVRMGAFEQFSFAGWNNETVHGYLVKPADFVAGRKYPVVFLIHGGPQGSFGNDWGYRWNPQTYAGRGYAAVMIDFHGSTGYGQAFTDSISGHWGDRPLEDLQKGWAAAQAHYPFLDANRACALGASYGGFMVNWIAGTWSQPWKCLVTHDGVFDDRMMGFSTEELWFSEWEHGGPGHTPWSDPAAYERFNPADHVAAWRVPQLIIHGARDYRIPIEQGLGAFTALQRRGVESRLLVFPDENHWVLKPANSLLWHATVEDWLRRHLAS